MNEQTLILQLKRMCAADNQRNVAAALGIDETLLSRILRGKRKISAEVAERLGYKRKIVLDKVGK
jgi:plasmid maintenance system antidote protein VapI